LIALLITLVLWVWLIYTVYFWLVDYRPRDQKRAIREAIRLSISEQPTLLNQVLQALIHSYALYPLRVVLVTAAFTVVAASAGVYKPS
jgi:O-antigen/teichoic acid export membrane protein